MPNPQFTSDSRASRDDACRQLTKALNRTKMPTGIGFVMMVFDYENAANGAILSSVSTHDQEYLILLMAVLAKRGPAWINEQLAKHAPATPPNV